MWESKNVKFTFSFTNLTSVAGIRNIRKWINHY